MRMYVCLSCLQIKQGDSHRVDMNICETCSSDLRSANKGAEPGSRPPSLYMMNTQENHGQDEHPSAFC
jgi:hypothetical protein